MHFIVHLRSFHSRSASTHFFLERRMTRRSHVPRMYKILFVTPYRVRDRFRIARPRKLRQIIITRNADNDERTPRRIIIRIALLSHRIDFSLVDRPASDFVSENYFDASVQLPCHLRHPLCPLVENDQPDLSRSEHEEGTLVDFFFLFFFRLV